MCREELERMRADGGEKRDEWRLNSSFEHLGVTVQLTYA